jgi:hypothetical protein
LSSATRGTHHISTLCAADVSRLRAFDSSGWGQPSRSELPRGLGQSASLKNVDDQQHERNDQDNVDQAAPDAESKSQCPHQQQDNQKGPQHKSPLTETERIAEIQHDAFEPALDVLFASVDRTVGFQ